MRSGANNLTYIKEKNLYKNIVVKASILRIEK